MDDAVAYALTKAVCENAKELGDSVASMSYFDPTIGGSKTLTGIERIRAQRLTMRRWATLQNKAGSCMDFIEKG